MAVTRVIGEVGRDKLQPVQDAVDAQEVLRRRWHDAAHLVLWNVAAELGKEEDADQDVEEERGQLLAACEVGERREDKGEQSQEDDTLTLEGRQPCLELGPG